MKANLFKTIFCVFLAAQCFSVQAVVFTSDTSIGVSDRTYDGMPIVISNCVLTVDGAHSFSSVRIANGGILTHSANDTFNSGLKLIIAGDFEIEPGANINISGRGYSGGTGSGAGGSVPATPETGGGGGGGNGGNGGDGFGARGGTAYDVTTIPLEKGSGGGAGIGPGGAGGGAIQLTISGSLIINGGILANGTDGINTRSGGGAGGSILIAAQMISGSGVISANGGAGEPVNGGGGGGGGIALNFATNFFNGIISARGGLGFFAGGAGTIYQKSSDMAVNQLTVDNGGITGASTPIQPLNNADLTVTGGAVLSLPTKPIEIRNLLVASAGKIAGSSQQLITLNITGTATVESGGAISADGGGYAANAGLGRGATGNSYPNIYGAGAGHGGYGVTATNSPAVPGGTTYDSITEPTVAGSGGGGLHLSTALGGAGGGAIRMMVAGNLVLDGEISADGISGIGPGGGGGSGGSIWLTVGSLSGSGSISANGGNGSGPTGGGAGGGRIAIEIQNGSSSLSGPITAYGGVGPGTNWGGAGTIYLKQTGQQFGQIVLDNAGHFGTNTPVSNLPASDLILRGAARGVLSASQTFHNLFVTDHATLFCSTPGASGFTINIIGNATVESGCTIDGDGLGYSYGGPGGGSNGNGAGHGGSGGLSATTGSGGGAYDLFSSPMMPGSAGNPAPYFPYYVVGAGGAVIRLNVSGSLILDGQISANGTDSYLAPLSRISSIPYNTIGGGSGGSIWISAGTLSGTGMISANGGKGFNNGGGGGGGRIAVSGGISGFAGSMSAHGGMGFNSGGAGTIYTKDDAKDGALLLADNGGISGAGTPLPSLDFATDLAIAEGTMATSTGSLTLHDLNIASNAWLQPASGSQILLTGSGIVNEGGGIIADGTGFAASSGIGAGLPNPNGGGGGGHGGYGALNTLNGLNGGNAYDSIQNPALAGSGGASGNSFPPSTDGSGGGVIHLTAQQTLTVNGKISANGSDGDVNNGGGGAGGSVWLSVGTLAGTGTISANGGSGGIGGVNGNPGYGGGGGRIAIRYSSNLFSGNLSAHGGGGAGIGGAGTIFLNRFTQLQPIPQIIVDNAGLSGTNTPLDSAFDLPISPFDLIVQNNGIVNFPTRTPVLNNLILNPGGIVSALPVNANLNLAVVQNVIIASNSAIDLDGKGFTFVPGPGPGAGTFKFQQGSGGAGYGGAGGMSASGVPGGITYGSATRPVDRGSRGGASGSSGGSEGGGAVHLTVGGTLNVNGGILANGNPGTQEQSGGGSGGSIWISANSLEGTGAIQANGGAGELYDGGGGGGGRIAIYSPSNAFAGTLSVVGAVGAFNGSDGTVFISTNLDLFDVLSQTPTGILSNTISQVDMEFSSVLKASSVSRSDFALGTPNGIETNLTISVLNPTTVRISFPEQTSSGDYSIQAGPQIENFLGQPMSAAYTGAFTILLPDIAPTVAGGIQGTNLLMSWTTLSGITYQIYSSTNLTDWIPYGDPIVGDGNPVEMQLPMNIDPTKFFRVKANRP